MVRSLPVFPGLVVLFTTLGLASAAAAVPAGGMAIDAHTPGQSVTVTGSVDRITDDDEFILRDATGSIRVYVGPNAIPAAVGDVITVFGAVDDDLPMEIYATSILRADGTRIDLPHDY